MTAALASGARVEVLDTLDSTSLEAKRRAAAGEIGPLWILALKQTSGYGRRGSEWVQREGDVAATLLFRPDQPVEILPQLSFVAGLAVADAIASVAPNAKLSLKWPNDVLASGAKIAGILLELIGESGSPLIALGVGVNVVSSPSGLDYPTARLLDFTETPPQPHDFVAALDEVFQGRRRRWEKGGFDDVRREWLDRAEGKGRRLRVRLANEIVEGVFEDLDLAGALILDLGGERRPIAAGTILPPG